MYIFCIVFKMQCINCLTSWVLVSYKTGKYTYFIAMYYITFPSNTVKNYVKIHLHLGIFMSYAFSNVCKHFNNPWYFISPTCESEQQQLLKSFKQAFYFYLWHMYPCKFITHTATFTHYIHCTGDLFFYRMGSALCTPSLFVFVMEFWTLYTK